MRKCVIWLDGQLFAQTKEEAGGIIRLVKLKKAVVGKWLWKYTKE